MYFDTTYIYIYIYCIYFPAEHVVQSGCDQTLMPQIYTEIIYGEIDLKQCSALELWWHRGTSNKLNNSKLCCFISTGIELPNYAEIEATTITSRHIWLPELLACKTTYQAGLQWQGVSTFHFPTVGKYVVVLSKIMPVSKRFPACCSL